MTEQQAQYLRDHRLAVLGTGRRDGSPQLSLIMYHFDGEDIAISVTTDRAKWKNARRQPRVSMLVPDGRQQLILYGTAETVDDPDAVVAGHRRLRQAMGREAPADDEEFHRQLQEAHRAILRIRPEKVLYNE